MAVIQAWNISTPAHLLVLLLSIVVLGLSTGYGNALAYSPLQYHAQNLNLQGPSLIIIIFYSGFAPLLSIFVSTLAVLLHCTSYLVPTTALTLTTINLISWIVEASIWLDCEVVGVSTSASVSGYCPQVNLRNQGAQLARGLSGGKTGVAWVIIAVELIYLCVCIYAVVMLRRDMGMELPGKGEDWDEERSQEGDDE